MILRCIVWIQRTRLLIGLIWLCVVCGDLTKIDDIAVVRLVFLLLFGAAELGMSRSLIDSLKATVHVDIRSQWNPEVLSLLDL